MEPSPAPPAPAPQDIGRAEIKKAKREAVPKAAPEPYVPKVRGGPKTYFVSVPTGIESVARAEIEEKLKPSVMEEQRGKLFFTTDAPPSALISLKSVEYLYVLVDIRSFVPPAADRVEETLLNMKVWVKGEMDLLGALSTWNEFRRMERATAGTPLPADADALTGLTFKCHCYRSGERSKIVPSPRVGGFVGAAFLERFGPERGWRVDLNNGELEIYIYLNDDLFLVAFPLLSDRLSKRQSIGRGETGILKPCVCYAMARLAQIRDNETVLDPMCGNGTLLLEGIASWPRALYWGGDIDPAVLQSAVKNVNAISAPIGICRWDVRSLPIASTSIDVILCDIPWGRQHGNKADNRKLYPLIFAEFHRILRSGGRAVIITTMDRIMFQYLFGKVGKLMWESPPRKFVNVGNLEAYIYVMRKKDRDLAREAREEAEAKARRDEKRKNAETEGSSVETRHMRETEEGGGPEEGDLPSV